MEFSTAPAVQEYYNFLQTKTLTISVYILTNSPFIIAMPLDNKPYS